MSTNNWIDRMARIGLSAKGVVYCLIGLLVLVAVIKGRTRSADEADKGGVFQFIQDLPAGQILLSIVVLGLICYAVWRFVQAFRKDGTEKSDIAKKIRYISSGLVYGAFSFYGIKLLMGQSTNRGGGNEQRAQQVLELPAGEWLLGLAALGFAGIGIYQIYYALSEKYKKHVSGLSLQEKHYRLLLSSGKAGYMARGIVWLILSFFLSKAALNSNAQEAGNTGDAFTFLGSASYGPYLLAALALGLLCYGLFNFIRAKFESFN